MSGKISSLTEWIRCPVCGDKTGLQNADLNSLQSKSRKENGDRRLYSIVLISIEICEDEKLNCEQM